MSLFNSSKDSAKKIRVFPQGLAISGDELTSFVLFKDKEGSVSFPIWCPVLPMGLLPIEGEYNNVKNPFDFTHLILNNLDFEITECVFDNIEADEQKASICVERKASKDNKSESELPVLEACLTPNPEFYRPVQKIKVRAFEALALCSSKKDILFSATETFIRKTRDVAVFEKNNPSEQLKKNSFQKSRQKYLM